MAKATLTSTRDLLPGLLTRLARQGAASAWLLPLWRDVAGEGIARQCRPVALEADTLIVSAPSQKWAEELAAWEPRLLERLAALGGRDPIRRLAIRLESSAEGARRPAQPVKPGP